MSSPSPAADVDPGVGPGAGRRIVVIEDEQLDRRTPSPPGCAARATRSRSPATVPSGVALCERFRPDLVVLDLMLPGLDGIEVCKQIQRDRPVPVLMLTARDSETDLLVGLAVGADDYMTKPFSMRELIARVHALLRRADRAADGRAAAGRAHRRRRARRRRRAACACDGELVHLTPIEFDLVALPRGAPRPGRRRREELLAQVWGYDVPSGARTVDSHIRSIRRKLGADVVRTVHGVGYAVEERHACT